MLRVSQHPVGTAGSFFRDELSPRTKKAGEGGFGAEELG